MFSALDALPLFDRLFDDVMNGVGGTALGTTGMPITFAPAIDVRATEDDVVFVCDVPGVKREDLDISIEGDTLTLKGERRYAGGEKDRVWLGRAYGAFTRVFTLPPLVDAEQLTADLTDGVLTIRVPKKPQAKPRRIQIGARAPKQLEEKKE